MYSKNSFCELNHGTPMTFCERDHGSSMPGAARPARKRYLNRERTLGLCVHAVDQRETGLWIPFKGSSDT